jgi:hypothetical protein
MDQTPGSKVSQWPGRRKEEGPEPKFSVRKSLIEENCKTVKQIAAALTGSIKTSKRQKINHISPTSHSFRPHPMDPELSIPPFFSKQHGRVGRRVYHLRVNIYRQK